jgi:hypothetical protein
MVEYYKKGHSNNKITTKDYFANDDVSKSHAEAQELLRQYFKSYCGFLGLKPLIGASHLNI